LDRREGNEAVIKIPMYIISFENVWMENNFQDRRIYLIVPYLDEELRQKVKGDGYRGYKRGPGYE